jgi:hypothetical protein
MIVLWSRFKSSVSWMNQIWLYRWDLVDTLRAPRRLA